MAIAAHVKFENGDTRLLCYSDNESLSGIEISLKEELLGINGPICDFSVEGSYNCDGVLESMVYTAMEDILEESWNECQ